jgi:hypothetical protein
MGRGQNKNPLLTKEFEEVKASYATLYNVSRYLPSCRHLTDDYVDILSPTYKDSWTELRQEMEDLAKEYINYWLMNENPKVIAETLRPLQQTRRLRSILSILRTLALPEYQIYFDSDFKAIPNSFAMPSPFFVLSNKDKFVPITKTIIRKCGETTLEINGILLRAEDAQLTHALMFLMRRKLDKITEDGIHFTTSEVEIAKVMNKSNPYDKSTKQTTKEGLERLRGCVLTLTNAKGQWMIGGILNKATKMDKHEIKIVLDKDFIDLLEMGYVGLDPEIHFRLSPADANIYRYLMRQQSFNTFGTLSKRYNRKMYEHAGLGGIDPERHSDSYIRYVLKRRLQNLQNEKLLGQFSIDKNFTRIWSNEKDQVNESVISKLQDQRLLPEKNLSPVNMIRTPNNRQQPECPAGYLIGKDYFKYSECRSCDIIDDCDEVNDLD